jgi:hypothetical protein
MQVVIRQLSGIEQGVAKVGKGSPQQQDPCPVHPL